MKKIIILTTFLFLLVAGTFAQTVYITDGGKKYHAKNCSIVKTGKKSIDIAEAKKKGYTACASCKAPKEAAEKKKETAPAPKKQPVKKGK